MDMLSYPGAPDYMYIRPYKCREVVLRSRGLSYSMFLDPVSMLSLETVMEVYAGIKSLMGLSMHDRDYPVIAQIDDLPSAYVGGNVVNPAAHILDLELRPCERADLSAMGWPLISWSFLMLVRDLCRDDAECRIRFAWCKRPMKEGA